MALWLLMLLALSSANGEDACTTLVDSGTSASGEALLQTRRGIQQESVAHVGEEVVEKMPASAFLQGAFFGYSAYQGAPTCVPQQNRGSQGLQLQQLLRASQQSVDSTDAAYMAQCEASVVGSFAPLDATGFKETTSLCCPVQMEAFFKRLLQLKGYSTCSTRHLQGLMHWFTCVPDMDFEYVLSIIQNGNPCKYWAPIGQACPKLSEECSGQWCDTTTTTTDQALPENALPENASPVECGANEKVVNHVCVECPAGKTSTGKHDASGGNTQCEATECGANEKVADHVCVECPAGKMSTGKHDASGDNTQCEAQCWRVEVMSPCYSKSWHKGCPIIDCGSGYCGKMSGHLSLDFECGDAYLYYSLISGDNYQKGEWVNTASLSFTNKGTLTKVGKEPESVSCDVAAATEAISCNR